MHPKMGSKSYFEKVVESFINNPNSSNRPRVIKFCSILILNSPLSYLFNLSKCTLKFFFISFPPFPLFSTSTTILSTTICFNTTRYWFDVTTYELKQSTSDSLPCLFFVGNCGKDNMLANPTTS